MLDGQIGSGETMTMAGVAPPRFEARPPNPNSFTPLEGKKFYENQINPPRYEPPTIAGVESYTEPIMAQSPKHDSESIPPELQKLLLEMQSGGKKPNDVTETKDNQTTENYINTEITEEQKSFLTKVWDSIKKFFPWNWGKSDISQFTNELKQKGIIPKA